MGRKGNPARQRDLMKATSFPLRALAVCVAATLAGAPALQAAYTNPLAPAESADPFVVRAGDRVHYLRTTGSTVQIRTAADLESIGNGTVATVFQAPHGPILSDVWAPELRFLDGKWYVYACGNIAPAGGDHRMFVLEATTDDPVIEIDTMQRASIAVPERRRGKRD